MSFVEEFIKNHPVKTVSVNGEKREYLVGGKGKTAFLIFPGSGQDAFYCYDLIDIFEKKYKAIAVNYTGIYSVDSFFQYINSILSQERVEKVILYGLSIGGFLAQHYVRRYRDKVLHLIISHSGTTKSKTIIRRVAVPGKIIYPFLSLLPQSLITALFKKLAGRVQANDKNIIKLYEKYSDKENLERRIEFIKRSKFSLSNKTYLRSIYKLGIDMENLESKFSNHDLDSWNGRILILRTENDPLAQDNGMFKVYYPNAKVNTFEETGHLTPFIRYKEVSEAIEKFLNKT